MSTAAAPHDATLHNLGWPRLLAALAERLHGDPGRAEMARLAPLPDAAAARAALATLAEVMALLQDAGPIPLQDAAALDEALARTRRGGALSLEELAAVRRTQRTAVEAARRLTERGGSLLRGLGAAVHALPALTRTLDAALTSDGELNPHTYPELGRLRGEMERRRRNILEHLAELLRDSRIAPHLQESIYSVRGTRYVLPVKIDARRRIPGIVHDVSASGATLFVEPQAVVDETNALTLAERQLAWEEQRILQELSDLVGEQADPLGENQAWLGRLDLLQAQGRLARDYGGSVPSVGEAGGVALRGLAHPLMMLSGERVVRNNVTLLPPLRCMIISGANTGGKTVLLTALGLAAELVRHGMAVPAEAGSRLDWFAPVWADVGDQQSLSASLSTFSAHIGFLSRLLPRCGTGSLVLMDEMLTGTEPQEGAALATAVLEHLVARDATVVITTHYGDLKRLATSNPAVVNASVSFDAERLQPTYRLIPQLPGSSFAFPIARRYGLPDEVVEAAQERLSHRAEDVETLLAQLHEREHELAERESHLRDQQRHQDAHAASQETREQALQRRERELRAQERGAVSNELRQARRQIAAVIHKLQAANDLPRAGAVREELQAVAQELEQAPPAEYSGLTPAALRELPAEARLWVRSLERSGTLETVLDEGRRARLRMGTLTMDVDAGDLSLAGDPAGAESRRTQRRRQEAAEAAQPFAAAPIATTGPAISTSENTLDMRGQRVEEALENTERFLDLCVVKHVSPVILIHGHGTGRLRTALRDYLDESPYCSTWRAGERNEGGDGVTIVALSL